MKNLDAKIVATRSHKRYPWLVELLRDVSVLSASDVDAGWKLVVERVAHEINASGGFALLSSKSGDSNEPLFEWRPIRGMDHGEGSAARAEINLRWSKDPDCRSDFAVRRMFERAGICRAFRTTDLAPTEEEMKASPSRRLIAEYGITDRML